MSVKMQERFNDKLIDTMWDMVYELDGERHWALYDLLVWSEPDAAGRVCAEERTEDDILDMLSLLEGINDDVDVFIEFCMVVASMRF